MGIKYNSEADTLKHIRRVNELLIRCSKELLDRAIKHDNSKLESPEKELFDKYTQKLKGLNFNSEEYKKSLEELKPALDHHYARNDHHPEHYADGVNDMTLLSIIEMFFDWKASSERQNNGNILKSISDNGKRYNISDQMIKIFENTTKVCDGW